MIALTTGVLPFDPFASLILCSAVNIYLTQKMCSKLSVTFSLITQLHVNIPIHVHKGTCIKLYLWTEFVPGRYMYRDSENTERNLKGFEFVSYIW